MKTSPGKDCIFENFLESTQTSVIYDTKILKTTPWFELSEHVDPSLVYKLCNSSQILLNIDDIIEKLTLTYTNIFFVDGSVRVDLRMGAAVYSPDTNLNLILNTVHFTEVCINLLCRRLCYPPSPNLW